MSKYMQFACLVALVVLVSGCDMVPAVVAPKPTPVPPAVEMLPTLDGYTIVEGQMLTDYISKLSGGAALLSGQPELTAMITAVDSIVKCYQEVGAARARIYSSQASPLSAGTVAIADRGALTDPVNFFKCVVPVVKPKIGIQSALPEIKPCSANYTLTKNGNEFYVIYAGTTEEICQIFCSRLEGCPASQPKK